MFKWVFSILFLFPTVVSLGQIAGDYMVGVQLDIVKTDNSAIFDKAQFGAEVNYFVTKSFTGTTGFEIWTGDEVSFLIGARWYPTEDAFIRARGLIGENDLSIGGGWTKPINDRLRFEAIGDFYFKIDFSIRVGLVYIVRR